MANRLTAEDIAEFSGIDGILKILGDSTAGEVETGAQWYRLANRFARKVAGATGHRPATVAAVIARLSPQVSWADNRAAAFEILSGAASRPACGRCYPDNVRRAEDIAAEDTGAAIAREVLPRKGYSRPKISAFYRNIAEPEIDGIVTVDTWAIRVWRGDVLAPAQTLTAKQSAVIQADYRAAAATAGLLAQELQAIVWVAAHRLAKQGLQRSLFDIGLTFKI